MTKTIRVDTNDPENSRLLMRVSGKVAAYITVEPRRLVLKGKAGQAIAQTVRIIPETDDPLTITKVSAVRGEDFDYFLEKIELSGKQIYALRVENTRQEPGRYYDTIHLSTDSDAVNTISVVVAGVIQPADKDDK